MTLTFARECGRPARTSLLAIAQLALGGPDIPQSRKDHCLKLQTVRAGHPAVSCSLPCDPSQPVIARQLLRGASDPRAPATRAGNPRLSFLAASATPPRRVKTWDRGVPRDCGARSDDANKRLR